MSSFTHIDDEGHVRMVDVTDKQPTVRVAVAEGSVDMKPETFQLIRDQCAGNRPDRRDHGC